MNSIAYQSGCDAALNSFKISEWNWKLTGGRKKDAISTDNGRRSYGVRFNESTRPSRSVGQAFDSLNSTRPSDFINAGNEALIGAAP